MTDLTDEEQKHVRAALHLLRRQAGGWVALGKVLGFQGDTLEKVTNGRRNVTATLAFRVARLVKTSVDALLAGEYVPEGTCPHCGRHPDDWGLADMEPVAGLKLVK